MPSEADLDQLFRKPQPGDDNDEEEDDDEDDDNCEGDNSQQQDAVDIQPGSEKDDADSSDKALSVYSESSAKRSQDALSDIEQQTIDLYNPLDLGVVDGPDGLIDQADDSDESSKGDEVDDVAVDVDDKENTLRSRKKTGVESKKRQNRVLYDSGTSEKGWARLGKKGDMFWRSFDEPTKDWAVVEGAKTWNVFGQKYIVESTLKLPRQLHDVLIRRTQEVGSPDKMRTSMVPGLIIGGPVI
ncbi:hypothetical protein EDD21DRAFT_352240 [Dissophora ornata]|nr:hypothetical protein EDD21DRAFT_352240 [Dissophora ornata]